MTHIDADRMSQVPQPPPYMPGVEPIAIQCGRLKLTGILSANIRGLGQITFDASLIHMRVKARQDEKAALIAALLAAMTSFIVIVFLAGWAAESSVPLAFLCPFLGLFVPSFFVLDVIFHYILKKNRVLQIDPATHAYYYILKKKAACLQLPDGHWIAVRARDKRRHEELRIALDAIYGGRCRGIGQSPLLMGPGGAVNWTWSVGAKGDKIT